MRQITSLHSRRCARQGRAPTAAARRAAGAAAAGAALQMAGPPSGNKQRNERQTNRFPPAPHRYASISSRTNAVRERDAAQIQRSCGAAGAWQDFGLAARPAIYRPSKWLHAARVAPWWASITAATHQHVGGGPHIHAEGLKGAPSLSLPPHCILHHEPAGRRGEGGLVSGCQGL